MVAIEGMYSPVIGCRRAGRRGQLFALSVEAVGGTPCARDRPRRFSVSLPPYLRACTYRAADTVRMGS